MKKLFFFSIALLFSFFAQSQTVPFHENFELPSLADSVVSSGSPGFAINTNFHNSGLRCDSSKIATGATSALTTNAFSTIGNTFIILEFSHIAKTEFLDGCIIQVSNDNGATWTQCTSVHYLGTSNFAAQGNKFCSASYTDWLPGVPGAIPTDSWWRTEQFDISVLASNAANVKVRFQMADGNGNGANGNYGWLIDDIKVTIAASELNPPVITYVNPIFLSTVYNLGPFNVRAKITDASGIDTAIVYYKVNNGSLLSVPMIMQSLDTFMGTIPAVLDGDSVHYYVYAEDLSPNHNNAVNPVAGFRSFLATSGIHFPYVDNFDVVNNLWTPSGSFPATQWQLGTPAYGATTGAHSSPNAWDVNLATTYGTSSTCTLTSPVFDFSTTANAKMSFWVNFETYEYGDGVRMEYTTNGTTWQVLGSVGDPNAVNWYNNPSIYSSSLPAWSGSSSGWFKTEYILVPLNNVVGPVQFRFVFSSYVYTGYSGFSIDDFAIYPQYPQDAGVKTIINPDVSGCIPAGNNTLSVQIKNFGGQTIHGPFDITYQLDSDVPVTESFTDSIISGALDTMVFATPLNASAGVHTLKVYTLLPSDGNLYNDTISAGFTAFAPMALPYYNPLETLTNLNDFCVVNGTYGRVEINTSAANTGAAGMLMDAISTTGWNIYIPDTTIGSLNYVWDPTVNPDHYASARLIVNTATFTNLIMKFDLQQLYYDYNEFTNFRVLVNGTMLTPHMMPAGSNTSYTTFEYSLIPFLPAAYLTIELQSKVYYPYNYWSPNGNGNYIDNIKIYEPPAQEATIVKMPEPMSGCGLGMDTVKIKIRNTGLNVINGNLNATYKVLGGLPITPEAVTATILPNDTLDYTFTTPIDLNVIGADSVFTIIAWVDLLGDPFQYNDTIVKEVTSGYIPADPIITNVTIPYGTNTTLHAISPDSLHWYDSPTSTNYIQQGAYYTTPILYDTTVYYVEAKIGSAGSDFIVGTGTINNSNYSYPCPYGQYYNGAIQEFLIPASELIAAGMGPGPIQALSFDVVTPITTGLTGFNVSIGATSVSSLSSWITNGLTQVYATGTYYTISGWNTHTFTTPWTWDGTSNLIVQTCFDNYPNGWTDNAVLNQTTTSYVSSLDYHSDGGSVCTSSPSYITPFNQRPNIMFKGTSAGCPSHRLADTVFISGIPALDAGVVAINTPVTGINLTNSETVTVRIHNYGTSAISNFPVSYKNDTAAVVTETYTGTINPGDTVSYTFTQNADLSAHAFYDFKSWTSLTGDIYASNDTSIVEIINQLPVYCVSAASYTGDNDIGNVTFASLNNGIATPVLSNSTSVNTYTDFTSLPPTDVFKNHTYQIRVSQIEYYNYFYNAYVKAFIDYNQDGDFTDAGEQVFGAATTSTTTTVIGNVLIPTSALSGITKMRVTLQESGNSTSVTPCNSYSYGETEDYLLHIFPPFPKDAGISQIVTPSSPVFMNETDSVKVRVHNFGTDTLHTIPVVYAIDGGSFVYDTVVGNFPPGAAVYYTFDTPLTIPAGDFTLCAYTTLAGDGYLLNDTSCQSMNGEPPIVVMFSDDFEDTETDLYTLPVSSMWQWGVPNSTVINFAHSPTKCWKTRLIGNYYNSRNDYLYTPKFNFSAITGAKLRFWQWVQTQYNSDGCNVQYTINNGSTWVTLGYYGTPTPDPKGENWYGVFVNGKHAWSGAYSEWMYSAYDLSQFDHASTPVQFRFQFFSDATGNAFNGWAVDDVVITCDQIATDVGAKIIVSPVSSTTSGASVPVTVRLKNYGTDTLYTTPVSFKINSLTPVQEIWNGTLFPDSTVDYTFTTQYLSPVSAYTLYSYTKLTGDLYKFNDTTHVHISTVAAPNDVGVVSILQPGLMTLIGTTDTVKIRVKNYGTLANSNFPVSYKINSGTPVTETFTNTINPNDSAIYQFATTYACPLGNYTLCAYTGLLSDMVPSNDEKCSSVLVNIGIIENSNNGFSLEQNIPNPANSITIINYSLPGEGEIKFDVRNVLGQMVFALQGQESAGQHSVKLNLKDLPSGIYYYSLEFEGKLLVRKMLVQK